MALRDFVAQGNVVWMLHALFLEVHARWFPMLMEQGLHGEKLQATAAHRHSQKFVHRAGELGASRPGDPGLARGPVDPGQPLACFRSLS